MSLAVRPEIVALVGPNAPENLLKTIAARSRAGMIRWKGRLSAGITQRIVERCCSVRRTPAFCRDTVGKTSSWAILTAAAGSHTVSFPACLKARRQLADHFCGEQQCTTLGVL